jgi:hypothetical protein
MKSPEILLHINMRQVVRRSALRENIALKLDRHSLPERDYLAVRRRLVQVMRLSED